MVQKSNDAAMKDVQTMQRKKGSVSDMGQLSNDVNMKDVKIKLSEEEYAECMAQS
jgi:hypothetical protein